MAKKKIIKKRKIVKEVMEDYFEKNNKKPDFLDYETLLRFMSERGKIQPRSRNGLNAKNQRRLSTEIKRARYLALIPYLVRPE
jgi:small subunit ribosomal protein S18